MTEADKAIRIIPFSGKDEDWRMWSQKFQGRARLKKYKGVLTGDTVVPAHDESVSANSKEGKAREANDNAYTDLLLSSDDVVFFGLIDESKTDSLPDGDAHLAWTKLCDRYEPKTNATKVELKKEFNDSSLSTGEDPEVWISDLERVRQRLKLLKIEISEEDMVIHVLNNLPREYENLVELCEVQINAGTLKLADLKAQLISKYRRISKNDSAKHDTALNVKQKNKKAFKGRCNGCGKYGHKKADCWELEDNQDKRPSNWKTRKTSTGNTSTSEGKRFNGTCNYCGKYGHKEEDCYKKKNDKKTQDKTNTAAFALTSTEKDITDYAMKMNDRKNNTKMTDDIWICDSGATSHMMYDATNMKDLKTFNGEVTIGDGNSLKITHVGTLSAKVVQKDG